MGKKNQPEQLLETLADFTSKENWDKFFTIRGSDDSFEWYAEWAELRDPLLSQLSEINRVQHELAQILVPGCGNSRLSEQLYDVGFKAITNIDFSKVVISDMLRRNVRQRPDMRWRIMDMTNMQFEEESFHIVLDKGALDALMEPELGPKLGNQYLSEVKRILKFGGRFICLTLAESHVLGLLFSNLRFGWKVTIYAISQQRSTEPNLQTFMVVAEKDMPTMLHQIVSSFQNSSVDCSGNQACGLLEVLENENKIRSEYSSGSDVLYSLEDLQLGAKGDLTEFFPGRRLQLTLGREGVSQYIYRAVLLDTLQQSGAYMYHCGVFLVPKTRAHEWLFSSEEGQWLVVESSKAARLIMVLLDSSHASASMDGIQKDLSPLVRQLGPGKGDNEAQIPFMMASDGIKQRNAIHKVNSPLTGNIIIEDVVYENVGVDVNSILPSKVITFRRLVFQRSEGLVQSEALLTSEEASQETLDENERKKSNPSSRSKRRGSQRKNAESMKVYHGYLASSYHTGILSGFMLISSYIESVASARESVKTVILGLGAGLLPMFLHGCMPFLQVEVVELDTLVRDLARSYFGLIEDERLQVHIADGIRYVKMIADSAADDEVLVHGNGALCDKKASSSFSSCVPSSNGEGITTPKFDIVIVDVDSADSSSALTCPAAPFVEKSFLQTVKNTLSREGLFVVNLVSRSRAIKNSVLLRMKEVFNHLFSLQLEEDVNEVVFALCSESSIKEDCFPEAASQLDKLLRWRHPEMGQTVMEASKKITRVK